MARVKKYQVFMCSSTTSSTSGCGEHLVPLLGMTRSELETVAAEAGMRPFAARQMMKWLYEKGAASLDAMTDLSKTGRENLSKHYCTGVRQWKDLQVSGDGTQKFLFTSAAGTPVETVFIPEGDRATVCVSSQSGCKMHCKFCLTGKQGFYSQLTPADILAQIYSLPQRPQVTNIVFMGQGEPFDNYDNVVKAIFLLTSPEAAAMSPKRITLSTCGLLPALKRFVNDTRCNIAISLHSPFHDERMDIMPVEKAYAIADVVDYLSGVEAFRDIRGGARREGSHQRRLSFEYILLKGCNDTPHHVSALKALLRRLDCRVNVIPFHPYPGAAYAAPLHADATAFVDRLCACGINATLRRSRGLDISAACGMLASKTKLQTE